MTRSPLCVFVLLIALTATIARSAPIWSYPQTITQPDGSVIHCFASGDEFNHWLHDKAGYSIVQDPTSGYFVYAVLTNGRVVPSTHVVGKTDPETTGLQRGVRNSAAIMAERRNALLKGKGPQTGTPFGAPVLNNLVIFIRFADEDQDIFPDSVATYERMYNSAAAGVNSMRNYYDEVSYGQLTISTTLYPTATDSVLSYQDGYTRDYYRRYNVVTNPIGYVGDGQARLREQQMVKNAVDAVASQIPGNLDLDMNGNGYVDNIDFILSGDPEAWSDWVLWPHNDWLDYVVSVNGTNVREYNIQLRGFLHQEMRGVAALCHEMFHTLGAPDLYNYAAHGEPEEMFPVWGGWDLMGSKDQPNPMVNPPVHMGAYMKHKYGGWISSIPTISASGTYSLAPLTSSSRNCYKIPSYFPSGEFYVLEYRRRTGVFDHSIPGEGLLVYRIFPARTGNANGPPDEVYIYRPDGTLSANGSPDSAAYSADVGRVALTDSTNPSGFLSDGSSGGLNLSNVGYVGDSISFTVTFPTKPLISVESQDLSFGILTNTSPSRDTTFMVRNIGFAGDTLDVSLDYVNVTPDSALAVSPATVALGVGDSVSLTVSVRPQLLLPKIYSALVLIHSRYGFGQTDFSKLIRFRIVVGTDVAEPIERPIEFALKQNYPNPFNPTTTIEYDLPRSGYVLLKVYNVLGVQVATLVDGNQPAGTFQATWDASGMPSGVYFYRLTAGDFVQTRKMMVVR